MTISMFNQVSVPQSELLSLIAAAKSLGVRGLAEEGVHLNARLVDNFLFSAVHFHGENVKRSIDCLMKS